MKSTLPGRTSIIKGWLPYRLVSVSANSVSWFHMASGLPARCSWSPLLAVRSSKPKSELLGLIVVLSSMYCSCRLITFCEVHLVVHAVVCMCAGTAHRKAQDSCGNPHQVSRSMWNVLPTVMIKRYVFTQCSKSHSTCRFWLVSRPMARSPPPLQCSTQCNSLLTIQALKITPCDIVVTQGMVVLSRPARTKHMSKTI